LAVQGNNKQQRHEGAKGTDRFQISHLKFQKLARGFHACRFPQRRGKIQLEIMRDLLKYLLGSALALWFALILGILFLGFFTAILWMRGQQLDLRGSTRWFWILRRLLRVLPWVVLILAIALSFYNTLKK
jgi:hypothetical protein